MKEKRERRKREEKETHILREEFYIAFKSLEKLIIIVIISRRNIGEKRADTARMRVRVHERQGKKERERKNLNGDV